uniref:CASPASE_P20 domain-containing protein n=1 Tax=Ascaris lumbricoides TaxID=6252 RepID=A0A0M3IVB9_ASCLU
MYPNFSSPRGLALIINNRRFETMPERLGTDVDEANFSLLFRQLGYSPIVYRNLCSKEMVLSMQDFARRKEHSLVDSCVVCILTHGEHGELFGVDDQGVPVFELISLLNAKNCPALAHKPKIFFLQACRGQRYDRGFPGGDDTADGLFDRFFSCTMPQRNCNIETDQKTKSPIEADILISYATTPGYVSWRNSMKGSWFIQSICEVFSKYAKDTDILSMLTMVCFIPAVLFHFQLYRQKFPHSSVSHSMEDDVSHNPSI